MAKSDEFQHAQHLPLRSAAWRRSPLVTEIAATGAEVRVVRVVDVELPVPFVTHELVISDPAGGTPAARALDESDVAVVQHEYGIFGGRDGSDVIEVDGCGAGADHRRASIPCQRIRRRTSIRCPHLP